MELTDDEVEAVRDLLSHARVRRRQTKDGYLTELQLKNVAVFTDIQGAGAVFVVDGTHTNGVQRPADIRGVSKCLICDEYNERGFVCGQCKLGIKIMRGIGRLGTVNEVMEKLDNLGKEGLLEALELVTRENIQTWMLAQAEEMK